MNEIFTKGQIDRLGNKVREQGLELMDDTLIELQSYRTSHKESLSNVFTIICSLAKTVHYTSIATFRIKRFESIISKLDRYPDMRFSRMWDIGGCRCILKNETDVYKIKTLLEGTKDIQIVKVNDYFIGPQESGYKAIHLYVKHLCSDTAIEVQLRTLITHDWATLVEITDLLYDTRLKEIGDNKELLYFHKLLAKQESLSNTEKQEIFEIVKKYQYFERLSVVFARNYLRVRKQWLTMEAKHNHKFFLIEAAKDEVPKIVSFGTFGEAEQSYFNVYKKNESTNIVLTYLQSHNYNLIAIAYANYILTYHSFMNECLSLFESLIIEKLTSKKYLDLYNIYRFYNELSYNHTKNFIDEIDAVVENSPLTNGNKKNRNKIKRKYDEWLKDIRKQVESDNINKQRLRVNLRKNLPAGQPGNLICKIIITRVDELARKRINAAFKKSPFFKNFAKTIKKRK